MKTKVYSFRAPPGFIPSSVDTGAYIRGKCNAMAPIEILAWTALFTVPIIISLAIKNRRINKMLAELNPELKEVV